MKFSFTIICGYSIFLGMSLLMSLMTVLYAGCSFTEETSPKAEENTYIASEQYILKKLHDIIIPELKFGPPETIIDAVGFFKQASRDFDRKEIPMEQRGLSFMLKLSNKAYNEVPDGPLIAPTIPTVEAHSICMWDALKLVCDATGMKFYVRGYWVWIVPLVEPNPPNNYKGK